MIFAVDQTKLHKTVDKLDPQGDQVAYVKLDNQVISLETNGGQWYEIVIYENVDEQLKEIWFSDCIYDEEKPTNQEDLKNLMLSCLDLI